MSTTGDSYDQPNNSCRRLPGEWVPQRDPCGNKPNLGVLWARGGKGNGKRSIKKLLKSKKLIRINWATVFLDWKFESSVARPHRQSSGDRCFWKFCMKRAWTPVKNWSHIQTLVPAIRPTDYDWICTRNHLLGQRVCSFLRCIQVFDMSLPNNFWTSLCHNKQMLHKLHATRNHGVPTWRPRSWPRSLARERSWCSKYDGLVGLLFCQLERVVVVKFLSPDRMDKKTSINKGLKTTNHCIFQRLRSETATVVSAFLSFSGSRHCVIFWAAAAGSSV